MHSLPGRALRAAAWDAFDDLGGLAADAAAATAASVAVAAAVVVAAAAVELLACCKCVWAWSGYISAFMGRIDCIGI